MAYSEDLANRIGILLKGNKSAEEKNMFGELAFMVNGKIACGV